MCTEGFIKIGTRKDLTLCLLRDNPGVYFSHESILDYWEKHTSPPVRANPSLVKGTLDGIRRDETANLHESAGKVCLETTEMCNARQRINDEKAEKIRQQRIEKVREAHTKMHAKLEVLRARTIESEQEFFRFERENREDLQHR